MAANKSAPQNIVVQNVNTNTNQNVNMSNNTDGSSCPYCKMLTANYAKKVHGKCSMIWCLTLTLLTGGLIFCLGTNMFEGCKDIEVTCAVCNRQKRVIES